MAQDGLRHVNEPVAGKGPKTQLAIQSYLEQIFRLRTSGAAEKPMVYVCLWHPVTALHSAILNRPQHAQRGLLRLGQAPNARDVEALVKAITAHGLQELARLSVPKHDNTN
jgi:hypothetical protein